MTRTTHAGGCHCGAVRYEVDADITTVLSCNCSICQKTGAMVMFAPATDFRLLSGDDRLTDYQFAKKRIHHVFCSTCGIRSFMRGQNEKGDDMIAINVRCLDDFDVATVAVKQIDGKSF